MIKTRSRRAVSAIALSATVGLMGAACTTPAPYGGPTKANYQIKTTSVKVIESQDAVYALGLCVNFIGGCKDEPYTLNIGFTVKIGVPDSATAFVVQGDSASDIAAGTTHTNSPGEQATTQFGNVDTVSLNDLAQGAHLELAGVWSWAMEADAFAANSAGTVADLVKSALNTALASG